MSKHESAEWLPSPSGQRSGMPHKSNAGGPTPAHPLGPYAPRSAAGPSHSAGDGGWLPTPSGQMPHGKADAGSGSNSLNPKDSARSAPAQKGAGNDNAWLPTPTGQHEHAKSHDAARDGGGKG